MKKAVLLIRVSTNAQDLEQQTERVKAEALKDGYDDEHIIIIEDKESAVKLSEEERNGLNKLKHYVKTEDISCIYVYEISRISRQPATLYSIRDLLIKNGIQLIILNPFMKMLKDDGTLDEAANIYFGIFSSMAENEGYIRKARLKRGIDKKKKLGLYTGVPVAIGYKVENDRLVIDEPNAAIVRRVYDEYISGRSIIKITEQLRDEGWKTDTSWLTAKTDIYNILRREYYCGDKEHPMIISRDTYEKAREVAKNKTCYQVGRENDGLFKGLIRDEKTGHLFCSNAAQRYYTCKIQGHGTLSYRFAHTILWGIVKQWHSEIYVIKRDEFNKRIDAQIIIQRKIIKTMEDNITKNQDKIDRINERYIEGHLSKEKADILEKKTFETLQNYRYKYDAAVEEIRRLEEQKQKDNIIKITESMTTAEKIAVVKNIVEKITFFRQRKNIAVINMWNKITGERRELICNTRLLKIVKMEVHLRPSLNWNGKM